MALSISGDGITVANLTSAAKGELKSGRKNLIINGNMQVSQRGDYTTATSMTHNAYMLDRWKCNVSGVTGTLQDTSYKAKLVATSTASGNLRLLQPVEPLNLNSLAGQQVVISAKVTSNSSDARLFCYADAWTSNAAHTGGGSEETLSITVTVPSGGVSNFFVYVGLSGADAAAVSITSGDYAEISDVQLELGDTATDFDHRSYGEELALCQRYYYQTVTGLTYPRHYLAFGDGTAAANGVAHHPVFMRTGPSLSYSGSFQLSNASNYTMTSLSTSYSKEDTTYLYIGATGLTNGQTYGLRSVNDVNAYIAFDAEL